MVSEDVKVKPELIIQALEAENIESRRFWKPMHTQPLFQDKLLYSSLSERSVGEDLFERAVCLPSGTAMDEAQQQRVMKTIRSVF